MFSPGLTVIILTKDMTINVKNLSKLIDMLADCFKTITFVVLKVLVEQEPL